MHERTDLLFDPTTVKGTLEDETFSEGSASGRLREGTQIGRYTIIGRVGGGSMGIVYRASDPLLRREVALKLVLPEHVHGMEHAENRARSLGEARALAQLDHPNVVRIYDVGQHEDGLFLAMEFVEGTDVARWRRDQRPPWPRIVAVFIAAGRGLAAAHTAGIIHRDFKPANVLVGPDLCVRVMDFGLAQQVIPEGVVGRPEMLAGARNPGPHEVAGTIAYMAPDQYLGSPADENSDQYSFCVSLWEILFGRLPFTGRTMWSMGEAKAHDRRLAPPTDTDVPAAIIDVITRGLAADPRRRSSGMRAVLDVLQGVTDEAAAAGARSRLVPLRWLALGIVALTATTATTAAAAAGWWPSAKHGDACVSDEQTSSLRQAYARAVAAASPAEARSLAERLSSRWHERGCTALSHEWAALASRADADR